MEKENNKITNNCEELNNIAEEPNNGVEEPNNVVEESNQGILSIVFELILKAQIKLFSRPLKQIKVVEEPNIAVKEPNNVAEEPNSIVDKPNNLMEEPNNVVEEPDNLVEEPNNVLEKPGLFAKCQNEWCLQKGLQKPQHTKCESVTNHGKTCNNPEIKYGTTIGGFPYKNSSGNYEKWCEQLGGVYASHMFDPRSKFQIIQNPKSSVNHITIGTRTGYAVYGCNNYDDPGNWHWCDLKDGYWYNQSLDYHETSNNFITSITCMN